jgi:ADP-heptose:LPS heptosyltransferase
MNLKEQLLKRAAIFWWSMHGEKLPNQFTIPNGGLRANHLAVILPPEFEDFDIARYAFNQLVGKLKPYRCTAIVRENFRSWINPDVGAKFLTYDPNQKDLLGFPERKSIQQVKQLDADIVIDLTPHFSQYTAGLAAATCAPLRISLDKEHANRFFNLIIYPARGRSLQEQYFVLLSHI